MYDHLLDFNINKRAIDIKKVAYKVALSILNKVLCKYFLYY